MSLQITPEDHERGFKVIPVRLRSGVAAELRLKAPPALVSLNLYREMVGGRDITNELLLVCVDSAAELNRLDVDSLCEVIAVAMGLAFGTEKQKKILAMGEQLLAQQISSSKAGSMSALPWHRRAWGWIKRRLGAGRGSSSGAAAPESPAPAAP